MSNDSTPIVPTAEPSWSRYQQVLKILDDASGDAHPSYQGHDRIRHMPLPEGLAYKLTHFSRTGRIVLGTDELFKEASWFAVMMGQGLQPSDYNPLLDSLSAEENRAHLARIEQQIAVALGPMARHEDYIRLQSGRAQMKQQAR